METIPSVKISRCEDSVDRISDLPMNVIDNIMESLSIDDAARMSALSKKWRANWLSTPRLEFDEEFAELIGDEEGVFDVCRWSNIISSILLHHEGPITKLSLRLPSLLHSLLHVDISPWMSFVSRNGVKSLTVLNHCVEEPIFRLPSYFWSFVRLECLSLYRCNIGNLHSFSCLRNLLSLILRDVKFEANIFKEFIACCPLLEDLRLVGCTIHDPFIINMPNLKILIVAQILGASESTRVKNVSSLRLLLLGGNNTITMDGAADMMNLLANSSQLEWLQLSGETFKILANSGISSALPMTLKQLKVLSLIQINLNHMNQFLCALRMIQSCPNVQKLSISMRVLPNDLQMPEHNILGDGETNHEPKYTFNHLRGISIENIRGLASEIKLISYLLAFSPSLEKLLFTCHRTLKSRAELQLYRRMLQFRRASPNAEVLYVAV